MASIIRFAAFQTHHYVQNNGDGKKNLGKSAREITGSKTHCSRSQRDDVEVLSVERVLELAESEEIMVIGGGEIYALFMDHAKEIHKTIIETRIDDADTFAPSMDGEGFHLIGERFVNAGPRDEHNMIFQHWIR